MTTSERRPGSGTAYPADTQCHRSSPLQGYQRSRRAWYLAGCQGRRVLHAAGRGCRAGQPLGADRYETNWNVAIWADGSIFLRYDQLGFCSGENFPYELGAGPYLGQMRGMLLLTRPTYGLMTCTSNLITDNAGGVDDAKFIGIGEPTIGQVKEILQ